MRDGLRRIAIMIRSLAHRPGYAATAIATLALGIGATTAIYSILQGSILRPLPYSEPDQLLRVRDRYGPTGGGEAAGPIRPRRRESEVTSPPALDHCISVPSLRMAR